MHFTNLERLRSPYFYFSTNQKLEFTNVSRSVEEIFGYSRAQVIGMRYDQFVTQDVLNEDLEDRGLVRFAQNESSVRNSYRSVLDRSGQVRIIQLQCYGETDTQGNVSQIVGFGRDISSEWASFKTLFEELLMLEKLEDTLKDREKTVLQKVLDGKLNKTIARDLHVSERTIELDRKRLIEKFSATNSASLIAQASRLSTLREVFSWLTNAPVHVESSSILQSLTPPPTSQFHQQ